MKLARVWREHVAVSYDPNLRRAPTSDERARIVDLVSLSRVVKFSEDDAGLFDPGTSPEALAKSWLHLGPDIVIVTRGALGAVGVVRGGGRIEVPAAGGGRVVDTIGAGDAFTAGLIHALVDGEDLAAALELASVVARRTCERAGADPPWPDR
jgi:fructokinase